MPLTILTYPDPRLKEAAKEIGEITPELKQLAQDMAETMYANEGIGLAATQVGECCRLVVVDITGPEKREGLMVLVNPRIVESEGETETEEGCLSVRAYRSKVKRAAQVQVKARDLEGRDVVLDADDLLAVCLQHEIDHLDGKLFIDRISRLKRVFYDKKVEKWEKRKA
ncbi:MAG: peptide deformylase [Thermodesulfobacteriota bacterium]